MEANGDAAFAHGSLGRDFLLVSLGVITAVPLLLFATAARRIPLSMLGLLQYLTPTGQLLCGVLLLGEALPPARLTGFVLVWLALVVLGADALRRTGPRRPPVPGGGDRDGMAAVTADVLGQRALNRATLERQWLLHRQPAAVLGAVEHLVGLQAQEPHDPYHGLWSRLEGFQPDDLAQLLVDRAVVRIVALRGTLHLFSADDALTLRALCQPVLDKELARHPEFGPELRGVDLDAPLAFARQLLADQPRTGTEIRAAMAERFPDLHPGALAYACRNHLSFVQVPPRGLWGRSATVRSTTAEAWLGRSLPSAPSIDDVVLRYFAAFGPATVADVATWSRLTGLREVVERLRPRLRPFRDEQGRQLFDLPDAPRPDPDTPAPPRFLPMYDNVLLSHADRGRFLPDGRGTGLAAVTGVGRGAVLSGGLVSAVWRIERDSKAAEAGATLVVDQAIRLSKRATTAVAAEGRRLLRFLVPGAHPHDVRFVGLD